jgi:hypothetical protein
LNIRESLQAIVTLVYIQSEVMVTLSVVIRGEGGAPGIEDPTADPSQLFN